MTALATIRASNYIGFGLTFLKWNFCTIKIGIKWIVLIFRSTPWATAAVNKLNFFIPCQKAERIERVENFLNNIYVFLRQKRASNNFIFFYDILSRITNTAAVMPTETDPDGMAVLRFIVITMGRIIKIKPINYIQLLLTNGDQCNE